jgi:hypothetical protein
MIRQIAFIEERQLRIYVVFEELYRMIISGQPWPGEPLKRDEDGRLSIHDFVTRFISEEEADVSDEDDDYEEDYEEEEREEGGGDDEVDDDEEERDDGEEVGAGEAAHGYTSPTWPFLGSSSLDTFAVNIPQSPPTHNLLSSMDMTASTQPLTATHQISSDTLANLPHSIPYVYGQPTEEEIWYFGTSPERNLD